MRPTRVACLLLLVLFLIACFEDCPAGAPEPCRCACCTDPACPPQTKQQQQQLQHQQQRVVELVCLPGSVVDDLVLGFKGRGGAVGLFGRCRLTTLRPDVDRAAD